MMKNVFYFMLKALFVYEMFTFWSCFFRYVEKQLYNKAMVSFEIYDVTDWTANQAMKFGQLTKSSVIKICLQKLGRK